MHIIPCPLLHLVFCFTAILTSRTCVPQQLFLPSRSKQIPRNVRVRGRNALRRDAGCLQLELRRQLSVHGTDPRDTSAHAVHSAPITAARRSDVSADAQSASDHSAPNSASDHFNADSQ